MLRDYNKLSEINFSLPAVEYTDQHVQGIIKHDLTYLATSFFLSLLGNMIAETGILHGARISKLAKRIGCTPSCFYGKDNLIDVINATGMATLYIKNKKVYGRIHHPPKKRGSKNPLYNLSISMTHRICLQGLLANTEAKAVIRMLLILSMHCDLDSGEINVEKRACEWAEMIRLSRTSVERAIDWINEKGFAQLDRDYIVTGHLNYTAMARGFLRVYAEQQKELNAQAKAEREEGVVKPDYLDIELKLYKYFGINAKGWSRYLLREATNYLLKGIIPEPQLA
ncbi:MAG: hypothetical protein OXH00_03015 [Candidatus Poribacteria bacterium]|nr:hypothetical protein [Candidatus Poribacteria bacterium]